MGAEQQDSEFTNQCSRMFAWAIASAFASLDDDQVLSNVNSSGSADEGGPDHRRSASPTVRVYFAGGATCAPQAES